MRRITNRNNNENPIHSLTRRWTFLTCCRLMQSTRMQDDTTVEFSEAIIVTAICGFQAGSEGMSSHHRSEITRDSKRDTITLPDDLLSFNATRIIILKQPDLYIRSFPYGRKIISPNRIVPERKAIALKALQHYTIKTINQRPRQNAVRFRNAPLLCKSSANIKMQFIYNYNKAVVYASAASHGKYMSLIKKKISRNNNVTSGLLIYR